uniref:LuxR C-terminal-related transcriptional regulator n=1 Tax=Bradyrhizobium sp. (strain ORS 278) TaxID=114615 RepID=UPI00031F1939
MFGELSDREKACLEWAALGKSSWEVDRILAISEHTVVFHIKNAMRKLGVASRTLAAVRAMELGLIQPSTEQSSPHPLEREIKEAPKNPVIATIKDDR